MSLQVIEEIKKYSIESIIENFQNYYLKLETSGFGGSEPYLMQEIIRSLNLLKEEEKILSGTIQLKSLEDYYEILNVIIIGLKQLKNILDIFIDNPIDLSKQGTTTTSGISINMTFITSLSNMLNNNIDLYNNYANNINSGDLIQLMVDDIFTSNNISFDNTDDNTNDKKIKEFITHNNDEIFEDSDDLDNN
jgi:hypothetical protein